MSIEEANWKQRWNYFITFSQNIHFFNPDYTDYIVYWSLDQFCRRLQCLQFFELSHIFLTLFFVSTNKV